MAIGGAMAGVLMWLRALKTEKEELANADDDEDAWWERLPSPPATRPTKAGAAPQKSSQRMALAGIAAEVASEYLLPPMAQPAMRGVRRAMAL